MLRLGTMYELVKKVCFYNTGFEFEVFRWLNCYDNNVEGSEFEKYERAAQLDEVIGGCKRHYLGKLDKLTMEAKLELVQSVATNIEEYFYWINYHNLADWAKDEWRALEELQFFCWEMTTNLELLKTLLEEAEGFRDAIEDAINDFL